MIAIEIKVNKLGPDRVQILRTAIANPGVMTALHTRIATDVGRMVQEYVASDDSHVSAMRLGAAPTGHMARTASRMEFRGDADKAVIGIPRKSRLRAAFGDFTITPTEGHKYLCIPASPITYGRQPAEFGDDAFRFAILYAQRPFPVLFFKSGIEKGNVAYWLRTSVDVKEDRTLLPFDEIPVSAARVASDFLTEASKGGATT